MLYAGILGYFAAIDGNRQLSARANHQIIAYRLPSYGAFSATAQPNYWFGIPRTVFFPGVKMDVDRIFDHVEAKDADKQKRIAFVTQIGSVASGFEHAIPERMLGDPTSSANAPTQPHGVSAVKALAIAASQGQRIYTLNLSNQLNHAAALATLQMATEGKLEISNALAAGKEVTFHPSQITIDGWTGSGYLIIDPETGAGAYKIGGGANGGFVGKAIFALTLTVIAIAIILPVIIMLAEGITILSLVTLGFAVKNAKDYVRGLGKVSSFSEFNKLSATAAIDAIFDITAAFFAGKLAHDEAKATDVEFGAFIAAIMAGQLPKGF